MVHNIITRGELKTIGIISEDVRTWGWCRMTLQETWLLTRPLPQRGQELLSPSQANLGMRCVTSPHWCHCQHIGSPGSFQIFTIYVITPERHYGFPRIFAIAGVILHTEDSETWLFFYFLLNYAFKKIFVIINKCLNTQDESSRPGRWVCLSDPILAMLSIECLWHTLELGMTEWLSNCLFIVTAVASIVGPETKNPPNEAGALSSQWVLRTGVVTN